MKIPGAVWKRQAGMQSRFRAAVSRFGVVAFSGWRFFLEMLFAALTGLRRCDIIGATDLQGY